MIKVVGSVSCAEAVVEQDPWIALKVPWLPRPAGQPLYLRVSGEQGGDLELKVDPRSGILVQAIVIDPPREIEVPDSANGTSGECLVPVIDPSVWGAAELEGIHPAHMEGKVISTTMCLGFWSTGTRSGIRFGNLAPVRYVACGRVRVGISDDSALAEIDTTF